MEGWAFRCVGPRLFVGFPSFLVRLRLQNLKAEKAQQLLKIKGERVRIVLLEDTQDGDSVF